VSDRRLRELERLLKSIAQLMTRCDSPRLQSREEATVEFQGRESPIWQGETVILIDNGTQGAGEIFATIMRQLGESRLVGRTSFGDRSFNRKRTSPNVSCVVQTTSGSNEP